MIAQKGDVIEIARARGAAQRCERFQRHLRRDVAGYRHGRRQSTRRSAAPAAAVQVCLGVVRSRRAARRSSYKSSVESMIADVRKYMPKSTSSSTVGPRGAGGPRLPQFLDLFGRRVRAPAAHAAADAAIGRSDACAAQLSRSLISTSLRLASVGCAVSTSRTPSAFEQGAHACRVQPAVAQRQRPPRRSTRPDGRPPRAGAARGCAAGLRRC